MIIKWKRWRNFLCKVYQSGCWHSSLSDLVIIGDWEPVYPRLEFLNKFGWSVEKLSKLLFFFKELPKDKIWVYFQLFLKKKKKKKKNNPSKGFFQDQFCNFNSLPGSVADEGKFIIFFLALCQSLIIESWYDS